MRGTEDESTHHSVANRQLRREEGGREDDSLSSERARESGGVLSEARLGSVGDMVGGLGWRGDWGDGRARALSSQGDPAGAKTCSRFAKHVTSTAVFPNQPGPSNEYEAQGLDCDLD